MKKLYYRCETIVNDVLEAEAKRLHITKNQLIDDVIRRAFDINKVAKQYQKFTETEQKILYEMVLLSAEIVDIHEAVNSLREDFPSDESVKILLIINTNLLQIMQRIKDMESQIRSLSTTTQKNPDSDNSS